MTARVKEINFALSKKLSFGSQVTPVNKVFHDLGGKIKLACPFHDHKWPGDTEEARCRAAMTAMLTKSPYHKSQPTADEKKFHDQCHHTSDVYDGLQKCIIDSIVYECCPNKPKNYTSPFHYHALNDKIVKFLQARKNKRGRPRKHKQTETKTRPHPHLPPPTQSTPKVLHKSSEKSSVKPHHHHHSTHILHGPHAGRFGAGEKTTPTPIKTSTHITANKQGGIGDSTIHGITNDISQQRSLPQQHPIPQQRSLPQQKPTSAPPPSPQIAKNYNLPETVFLSINKADESTRSSNKPHTVPSPPPMPIMKSVKDQTRSVEMSPSVSSTTPSPEQMRSSLSPTPTSTPSQQTLTPSPTPAPTLSSSFLPSTSVPVLSPDLANPPTELPSPTLTDEQKNKTWTDMTQRVKETVQGLLYKPFEQIQKQCTDWQQANPQTNIKQSPEWLQADSQTKQLQAQIIVWLNQRKDQLYKIAKSRVAYEEEVDHIASVEVLEQFGYLLSETVAKISDTLKPLLSRCRPSRQVTSPQMGLDHKLTDQILSLKQKAQQCGGPQAIQVADTAVSQLLGQLSDPQAERIVTEAMKEQCNETALQNMWQVIEQCYETADMQKRLEAALSDDVYQPVGMWWDAQVATAQGPTIQTTLKQAYDLANRMDRDYWKSRLLPLLRPSPEKKTYVMEGDFARFVSSCLLSHRIMVDVFDKQFLPSMVSQWVEADWQVVATMLASIRGRFAIVLRFLYLGLTKQQCSVESILAWLTQTLPIAHDLDLALPQMSQQVASVKLGAS
jgi:hypothetical protein